MQAEGEPVRQPIIDSAAIQERDFALLGCIQIDLHTVGNIDQKVRQKLPRARRRETEHSAASQHKWLELALFNWVVNIGGAELRNCVQDVEVEAGLVYLRILGTAIVQRQRMFGVEPEAEGTEIVRAVGSALRNPHSLRLLGENARATDARVEMTIVLAQPQRSK